MLFVPCLHILLQCTRLLLSTWGWQSDHNGIPKHNERRVQTGVGVIIHKAVTDFAASARLKPSAEAVRQILVRVSTHSQAGHLQAY